jgi:osmotically-inducible protein OsmY
MSDTIDHDLDIQLRVRDELDWAPEVDPAGIGVAVNDRTVTLSGEVPSYAQKTAATEAALRVKGVRTVVDDLVVAAADASWRVNEAELSREVDHALRAAILVPDTVKAEVHKHSVTLVGDVDWDYQRAAALRALGHLRGIRSIHMEIGLTPREPSPDAREGIVSALTRSSDPDLHNIRVSVTGTTVTLTGTVSSAAARRHAASIAWSSPHVTDVENLLIVG